MLIEVPVGFNNNIIWNMAHMTCAQQGVCYLRSGQQTTIEQKFITPYLTNTKPDQAVSPDEIEKIKYHFVSTIDQLQADYEKNMFSNYTTSPNILRVYGVELKNIEDAFEFLLYHDGVHSGAIMSLKKLVTINQQKLIQ